MLGEGSGGGALALLPADRVVAAQHAWLSPLPPEGASAIVHRDTAHAPDMARAQKVRALDLHALGIVDRVVAELPDAADEPEAFCRRVGAVLQHELAELLAAARRRPPSAPVPARRTSEGLARPLTNVLPRSVALGCQVGGSHDNTLVGDHLAWSDLVELGPREADARQDVVLGPDHGDADDHLAVPPARPVRGSQAGPGSTSASRATGPGATWVQRPRSGFACSGSASWSTAAWTDDLDLAVVAAGQQHHRVPSPVGRHPGGAGEDRRVHHVAAGCGGEQDGEDECADGHGSE